MAMVLFTKLDEEWVWLARSKRSTEALHRWAETHPVLSTFADLDELIEFVQRRNQAVANDRVHVALVDLAATDQLAARTMLCAVQPGLVAIAMQYRTAGDSHDDVASAVVAAAIERIRTYPLARRPACVAANVLLDTRQIVGRALFRPRVEEVELPAWSAHLADPPRDPDPADELREVLERSLRSGRLAADDVALILRTRVEGVSFDEVASQQGTKVARLRQRRLRAEAAMVAEQRRPEIAAGLATPAMDVA